MRVSLPANGKVHARSEPDVLDLRAHEIELQRNQLEVSPGRWASDLRLESAGPVEEHSLLRVGEIILLSQGGP